MTYRPLEERFWEKVEKTDTCWNWTGYVQKNGYGKFRRGDEPMVTAHRMSYELANGPIPKGLMVDHLCHNRACVNDSHLRLLTAKQNNENRLGANRNSSTGVRGVLTEKGTGKYRAVAGGRGPDYYVGSFDSIEEAAAAAIARRNKLFTHNDIDRRAA
ncbi:HNH endonuclease signature motif containing protein [Arthrobacter sp. MDT1-65]